MNKFDLTKEEKEQLEKDLALALMYLTGFSEPFREGSNKRIYKSWKGYKYEIMKALDEEGLVKHWRSGIKVTLTDKGMDKAFKIFDRVVPHLIEKEGEEK